jgi:hypothetical protein
MRALFSAALSLLCGGPKANTLFLQHITLLNTQCCLVFVAITSHFPSSVHSSLKHCIEKKTTPQSKILHCSKPINIFEDTSHSGVKDWLHRRFDNISSTRSSETRDQRVKIVVNQKYVWRYLPHDTSQTPSRHPTLETWEVAATIT